MNRAATGAMNRAATDGAATDRWVSMFSWQTVALRGLRALRGAMALDAPKPSSLTSATTPREFLRAREAVRGQRVQERLGAVRGGLPEVARLLIGLGAERVWAFGSIEDGTFKEGSDLNLAVLGLPAEVFILARVAVSDLVPVEVDLVELERAPVALRAHILASGRGLGDVG